MKFLLNTVLVSGAVANVIFNKREVTIDQVAKDISGLAPKLDAVDSAVEAFKGDPQQALAIQSAAKDLTTAVEAGTADAKSLSELKQEDALSIAQPVQDLEKSINKTIGDLIAKKDVFVKAGLGGAVHEILVGQEKSAGDFTDAILGKLPTELQPIGQQLAAPVVASVKQGIAAFAGLSGTVASAQAGLSGTGSSSSASSSPASPPASSAGKDDTKSGTTAPSYGAPPATNTTTSTPTSSPTPIGGGNRTNSTNTTSTITPYTGAAPSTAAASAASAFGLSAIVGLVALAAL